MKLAAIRWMGGLVLCALVCGAVVAARAANVEPLWQLAPAAQGANPFVHLGNPPPAALGAAFGDRAWVLSVGAGVSGVHFEADDPAEPRRINVSFNSSNPPRAMVMDVGADHAVVGLENPHLLWLLGADGRLRWSKQVRASSALVFPGGDVAYIDDDPGQFIGLRRATDGAVVWARAGGDHLPSETPGDIRSIALGPNHVYAASWRRDWSNPSDGVGAWRFHALDRSTGATHWVVDTPVDIHRFVRCMRRIDDTLLVLFAIGGDDPAARGIEIERRSAASGQLLSTIVVPEAPSRHLACQSLHVGEYGVFVVHEPPTPEARPSLLLSVAATGPLVARHPIGRVLPGMLAAFPGSDDVLIEDVRSDGTHMLARWGIDGTGLRWERAVSTQHAIDARGVALRPAPNIVERLAWTADGVSIRQLNLSSGAIVGSRSHPWVTPSSALLLHRMTSRGLLRLEALPAEGPRRLRLSRIDVDAGTASQTLEFDTPEDLLPAYSAALMQANDTTLVLLTNHRDTSFAQDCRETTRIMALDAVTWSLRWQSISPTVLFAPRALDNVHFSIDAATRSGPPACGGGTTVVRALEAATGQERWTSPLRLDQATSTAGELFVAERGTGISRRFARLVPETGTPLWTITAPTGFSAGNILATVDGGLFTTISRSSSPGLLEVARRDRSDGHALWTTPFSDPNLRITGSVMEGPESGVMLIAGARIVQSQISLPGVQEFVAGIDSSTGETLFDLRPEVFPSVSTINLTPIPSASGSRWLSASTSGLTVGIAPISALRALVGSRAQTLLGGHHLLERRLGDGLGQIPRYVPFHAFPDGSMLASTAVALPSGAVPTTISRLPAPLVGATADLRLRPINDGRVVRGFGPRQRFHLEIDNPGAVDVPDVRLRYAATPGLGSLVWLRGCEVVGTGTCPTDPDALEDWRFGIGPNSTMVLNFEVLDSTYLPGRRSFMFSSGTFHLDPPFGIADPVLANNSNEVIVELFDMSSSFEQ